MACDSEIYLSLMLTILARDCMYVVLGMCESAVSITTPLCLFGIYDIISFQQSSTTVHPPSGIFENRYITIITSGCVCASANYCN